MSRKWIAYGVTGALGVAVLSGGAVAMASAMDLRTASGDVLENGVITGESTTKPAQDIDSGSIAVTAPESPAPTPGAEAGKDAEKKKADEAAKAEKKAAAEKKQKQEAGTSASPVSPPTAVSIHTDDDDDDDDGDDDD
ncbi:MAG: hypothetical protein ACTHZX_11465 [Microbacterium sp.]